MYIQKMFKVVKYLYTSPPPPPTEPYGLFLPWTPSLPLYQVLGLPLAEPFLGDGFRGENLHTQK